MKFTKMKFKTFIHFRTMKPTKLNNNKKKLKPNLIVLHGEIKRSEHIIVHRVECESRMLLCRKKVMLLCTNRSALCTPAEEKSVLYC